MSAAVQLTFNELTIDKKFKAAEICKLFAIIIAIAMFRDFSPGQRPKSGFGILQFKAYLFKENPLFAFLKFPQLSPTSFQNKCS